MFGTVLAMLNTSACRLAPSAATSSVLRTKPLSRDTIVPAAITALAESSELWVEGNLGPELPGASRVRRRRSFLAPPATG